MTRINHINSCGEDTKNLREEMPEQALQATNGKDFNMEEHMDLFDGLYSVAMGQDNRGHHQIEDIKAEIKAEMESYHDATTSDGVPMVDTNEESNTPSEEQEEYAGGSSSGEGLQRCDVCEKVFPTVYHLQRHKSRTHSGSKPYQCKVCGKSFSFASVLSRHEMIHTGAPGGNNVPAHNDQPAVFPNTFKTDVGDDFKNTAKEFGMSANEFMSSIERFENSSDGFKTFTEGLKASTSGLLLGTDQTGMASSSQDVKPELNVVDQFKMAPEADIKPVLFDSSDIIAKAWNMQYKVEPPATPPPKTSPTSEKTYQCNICGKLFSHSTAVSRHQVVHTGSKPFKCNTCGKCFSFRSSVDRHKRTHTGEKPYQCNICLKSFSLLSSLRRHDNVHTHEKSYSCHRCNKVFSFPCSLTRHMKRHEEVEAEKTQQQQQQQQQPQLQSNGNIVNE